MTANQSPSQIDVTPEMSDESLAIYLGLSADEAAIIIPSLTPEKRAVYERMASVEIDLNMGVVPDGVIVCKRCRHG